MLSLWTSIQEAFGYKTRQSTKLRDLSSPDQSLISIASDLSEQIFNIPPGGMISIRLQDTLQTLSREERSFMVNFPYIFHKYSPFTIACSEGLSEVVRYLCRTCSPDLTSLRLLSNPHDYKVSRAPALWHAVVANHQSTVEILLGAGADINARSDTGSTPINSACFLELDDMVGYLLKAGANINIPNNKGGTCLMNSVRCENVFTMLLEQGADMYAHDIFNKTALHYAIEENSTWAVRRLLQQNAKLSQADANDRKYILIAGALAGLQIYKALIGELHIRGGRDAWVDPDALEILGCTKFLSRDPSFLDYWILASRYRHARNVVKPINRSIAHFEYRSECVSEQQLLELRTLNHFACESLMVYMRVLGPTDVHLISTLEYYFYTLHQRDRLAATKIGFLLFNLALKKCGRFVEFVANTSYELIERCIILTRDGQSINFAILFESLTITRDSVEVTRTGINQASKAEKKLFDWSLNVILSFIHLIQTQANQRERVLLMVYIRRALLANGREEAQLRTVDTGHTLLHLAVSNCNQIRTMNGRPLFPNWYVVHLLLACGAPVNAVAFDGSSPLFVAAKSSNYNTEIVDLLLYYGAHHDQVGAGGDTAVEVLRRCLSHSHGVLEPPVNLPTVRSLQCYCALTLVKTVVDIHSAEIPQGLRGIIKLHLQQSSRSLLGTLDIGHSVV